MEPLDLKELDRLERGMTAAGWQRSRFVDGPQYRKMPAAWKESRGYEERLTIRGSGVVGTPGCNFVLGFRQGTKDADIEGIVATRDQLRPLLDLVDRMGEALTGLVNWVDPAPSLAAEAEFEIAYEVLEDYRRAKGE